MFEHLLPFDSIYAVQWIRSEYQENIHIDYMKKCLLRYEIRGPILINPELNTTEIKSWFNINDEEKKEDLNGLTDEELDTLSTSLLEIIQKRIEIDEELNAKPINHRVFTLKSLELEHQKLDGVIDEIKTQLLSNRLSVGTATKYLTVLGDVEENNIIDELMIIAKELKDCGEIAKSLRSLFSNLKQIEHYRLLHDTAQIFKRITTGYCADQVYDIHVVEDKEYQNTYQQLSIINIAAKTTQEIDQLITKHAHKLQESPLSDAGVNYLRLILHFGRTVHELFNKYHDDIKLENRMKLFSVDSLIDRNRSIALKKTRDTIVQFVRDIINTKQAEATKIINMSDIQQQLQKKMSSIGKGDVNALNTLTKAWHAIVNELEEATSDQFLVYKEMLTRIRGFTFGAESEQNQFDHEDTSSYLNISIFDAEEMKELEMISQNKFSSLLDVLSIFITDSIPVDIPSKSFINYSCNDLIKLVQDKQLNGLGLNKELQEIMYDEIRDKNITGERLSGNISIDSIIDLLFIGQVQEELQQSEVREIASEIIRTIDCIILRDRIQNEYLPKFNKCQEIAAIRLQYYFEGGS